MCQVDDRSEFDEEVRCDNRLRNEPVIRVANPVFEGDSMPVNVQGLRLG